RIFLVILGGSLFFVLTNIFTYYFINQTYFIPFSIIIIEFITSIFIMTTFRLLVKITYLEIINPSKEKSKVIIFGAGEAGVITKRALDRDAGSKLKVIGFIDDDKKKAGKKLEGVDIFGPEKMKEVLRAHQIDHLILSVQNLSPDRKKEIIETCLEYETRVLNVPPVVKWINGELSFSQIREINIDDLLGREVIKLDDKAISEELSGKNILVTGASGSIGSEIARQVAKYKPNKLMLLDQAESPLHQLELECADIFRSKNCEIIIADICNEVRMEKIFHDFMPTIIYHAAAYKHVPMMENNPVEALQTNVIGTKILADLAVKYNVGKFIMISTDKAVNPANVMGASKRIAEMYTQSQNQQDTTRFITTRFGNVLGSNGSVIPLFKKQIAEGGPITITHPEVTRYFMTIPEASQLVLDAGAMGKGG
ncbi:MAG: polysaccharide biosynthesis protein, partial [Bacteroidales bacterium]|nr:polysaccharide biosynthesis protein [Bacteroidales bacterium]